MIEQLKLRQGGSAMYVGAREFNDWLRQAGLPQGGAELGRVLGMNRTTIQNQRLRSRITIPTVVAAARAARLNPLDVLGGFQGYEVLADERRAVTDTELLSQVTYTDAAVHMLKRINAGLAHSLADTPMSPIPNPDSVRTWIDAIDTGELRRHIAEKSGVTTSNFSAQLTENRLAPHLAILASKLCDVSPASGLVVSGLVTPDEAGWPLYGRENALSEMGDIELIDLLAARLAALKRVTKKKIDDAAANTHYLETLG